MLACFESVTTRCVNFCRAVQNLSRQSLLERYAPLNVRQPTTMLHVDRLNLLVCCCKPSLMATIVTLPLPYKGWVLLGRLLQFTTNHLLNTACKLSNELATFYPTVILSTPQCLCTFLSNSAVLSARRLYTQRPYLIVDRLSKTISSTPHSGAGKGLTHLA